MDVDLDDKVLTLFVSRGLGVARCQFEGPSEAWSRSIVDHFHGYCMHFADTGRARVTPTGARIDEGGVLQVERDILRGALIWWHDLPIVKQVIEAGLLQTVGEEIVLCRIPVFGREPDAR